MPLPSSPIAHRVGAGEFHFGGSVGAVAELVLQPLEPDRVDGAIGRKARHEETAQALVGLRQHQEGVAHRRRHEPFMPGDAIGIAVALGARHVGAHVGAALLLGHAHAERHAALGPPRREARIVGTRRDHRHHLRQQIRLFGERRDRCARHGDRAEMAGLDLRGDIEFRGAHHFRSAAGRFAVRVPGRIVHAGMRRMRHQLVIGRVKLDFVAAVAAGIEGPQFRRILIGEPAPRRHRGRTPMLAEFGQFPVRRRRRHWRQPLRPAAGRRAKRSISSNGGDWLKTSWVANEPGSWLVLTSGNQLRRVIGKS